LRINERAGRQRSPLGMTSSEGKKSPTGEAMEPQFVGVGDARLEVRD
jgi:hypothetical protein